MAAPLEEDNEDKKKRRRKSNKKLLPGEKVEVRSVDVGFEGSWHLGVVIASNDDHVRQVQYDNLLVDDSHEKLIESITVSSTIEGLIPTGGTSPKYRSCIRPLPPRLDLGQWRLHYGICVDALYNDAWWEGVVFDHEDGCEERLIFFPDLGDEMTLPIEKLRLTQDWDEVSEEWKLRGTWLFLELIEKSEQDFPLLVSVRQIWYDVRVMEEFEKTISEWTYWEESQWNKLVLEAICRCQSITAHRVFDVFAQEDRVNFAEVPGEGRKASEFEFPPGGVVSECLLEEANPALALPEAAGCATLDPDTDLMDSPSKRRKSSSPRLSECEVGPDGQVEESIQFQQHISQTEENQFVSDLPSNSDCHALLPTRNSSSLGSVLTVSSDQDVAAVMNPGDHSSESIKESSGDAQDLICQMEDDGLVMDVLIDMDWSCHGEGVSMEPQADKNIFACISPNDEVGPENSLGREDGAQEIQDTVNGQLDRSAPTCDEPMGNPSCSDQNLVVGPFISTANDKEETTETSSRENEVQGGGEFVEGGTNYGCGNDPIPGEPDGKAKPSELRTYDWQPVGPEKLPGAEYDPDAIEEYVHIPVINKRCGDVALRARKHLSYLGWRIEFRKDTNRIRYVSSEGKQYGSLRMACTALMKGAKKVRIRKSENNQPTLVNVSGELLGSNSRPISLHCNGCSSSPSGETLIEDFSERRPISMEDVVVVEPEYCPQAVFDWYEHGSGETKERNVQNCAIKCGDLSLKAKKHLSAVGWKFHYAEKKGKSEKLKRELRYVSPKGRCYYSLRTACWECIEEQFSESILKTEVPLESMITKENSKGPLTAVKLSSPILCRRFGGSVTLSNGQFEKGSTESSGSSKSRELVEFGKVQSRGSRKHWKRRKNCSYHLPSGLLQSQTNANLQTRQDGLAIAVVSNRILRHPSDHFVDSQKLKKGKASRALINQGDNMDGSYPTRVPRSSKRARQLVVPSAGHHTPHSILSLLIDADVVVPEAKVYYICIKDHCPKVEGRITRDGIRCNCCQMVFTPSSFEAHTGSTYCCPAASIFLEDGRSLLDCQMQMLQDNNLTSFTPEPRKRIKSNKPGYKNDYICAVCHYGGKLLLCDQCPSSFHLSCLGLEDLPEGKWFCPSCRCGICGQSEFNENIEQFTEKTVLYCDQCEREYHVRCLRKREQVKLECCPKGNWFCSEKCEKIFVGLHKLLGKSVPVGGDRLSWTILKSCKDDNCSLDASDIELEAMAECHSKLSVALGVMHECFEPIKEPRNQRDLVEDVIFSNGSELNRLNFRGFYTMLLEREEELISVATFRVYGEKVAEVPLIGTCVQYRQLGMCRLLMNELEKILMELGVERLLLPAVPQVLHTWTTSFGFSKMTDSERLKFLEYTFLDFQDTTMCQKLLLKTSAGKSIASTDKLHLTI